MFLKLTILVKMTPDYFPEIYQTADKIVASEYATKIISPLNAGNQVSNLYLPIFLRIKRP